MIEIKVPSPGESISEVEIGSWLVETGSYVERDQEVVSLESEKASLTANAPESGTIEILFPNGTRVAVGSVIARIDPAITEKPVSKPAPVETPKIQSAVRITPVAREIMNANNLSVDDIISGHRRITKEDVIKVVDAGKSEQFPQPELAMEPAPSDRHEERKRMSLLREKLSERLVAVKNETAMLTTFNEIDMYAVIDLRSRYNNVFEKKYHVKLGFMSFFTLAASRALMAFPQVNAQLEGNEIVSYNYCDIGIAIQTPKGLMVPVLRNTQAMTLAQIEQGIFIMASKAKDNKISIEELQGGTFSITNGGTFGSLLSTPILNPPQSAILGMHNIVDRPVAINGQVVIRPMMYVALSYDHRLIDGKDAVGFLKTIRELIETPVKLLDPSGQAERRLLGI
ncbi:MAG: 2-oxoglutarate dehydrogenase complex dihydrolipoyllysine-residue succinyltransferase [Porphyromonadaceae bacterium]|nr:MAG: 2-oxoglutarate dehydrogenase complex dihydrolipoyllysine-residue succinyltransferase [Porphyromonadaceae bacterium]